MFDRIYYMGGHSRAVWWDVRCFGGWLVIRAGYWDALLWPGVYWSPDGSQRHHGARNVFRRPSAGRGCVCEACKEEAA